MAKTFEFSDPHAATHAVRVIQANAARRGIIAMVVTGIVAIVATLGIYAAVTAAHESTRPAEGHSLGR
jgi:uncharacterized membrane-anchored protein